MPTLRTAVYTGSFDPITLGHLDIIRRASPLFGELVIGIGINADKQSLFEPEQRVRVGSERDWRLGQCAHRSLHRFGSRFRSGMGARVMVRGIRPLTDIAGEFTMMMANQQLDPEIETVFLMASERFAHVSSSLLKQIAALSSDDEQLAKFVPRTIIPALGKGCGRHLDDGRSARFRRPAAEILPRRLAFVPLALSARLCHSNRALPAWECQTRRHGKGGAVVVVPVPSCQKSFPSNLDGSRQRTTKVRSLPIRTGRSGSRAPQYKRCSSVPAQSTAKSHRPRGTTTHSPTVSAVAVAK